MNESINDGSALAPDVRQALEPMLVEVERLGFSPRLSAMQSGFGNFEVEFVRDQFRFCVVRDRGQLLVGGHERAVLESVGLWRTFNGAHSMSPLLLNWLRTLP